MFSGLAGLFVLFTIDAADELPFSARGPGLTFDEGFNVEVGAFLVESLIRSGWAALHPATWAEIYNAPQYNPDHPPLGRLALGLSNALIARIQDLGAGRFYSVTYARPASALAYGLVIWIVSRFALRWIGGIAAIAAGLSLLLTPRLFAHAHLAALESWMNLTYAAFVLGLIDHWIPLKSAEIPPLRARHGVLPGLLLGMALLTKMQAVVLPLVFVVWGLWHWRTKAALPIVVAAAVSAAVFFLGWPWLWHDPLQRFLEYFSRSTERTTLYCFYLGERFADRDVPWHYPFVLFAVTTPALWLALGTFGIGVASTGLLPRRFPEPQRRAATLLLAAFLAPLILFSLPGVAVYDGVRLFLVAWPIFAVGVGLGCEVLFRRARSAGQSAFRCACVGVALLSVAPIASMIRLHPLQLSYYNEAVGGLRGAAALGFEPTYWGDSATPEFLERCSQHLPPSESVGVAPVLHRLNLLFLKTDSWLRQRPDLSIDVYDDAQPAPPRYVILIHRRADPWGPLNPPPAGTRVLEREVRDGVPLTEFLELP